MLNNIVESDWALWDSTGEGFRSTGSVEYDIMDLVWKDPSHFKVVLLVSKLLVGKPGVLGDQQYQMPQKAIKIKMDALAMAIVRR